MPYPSPRRVLALLIAAGAAVSIYALAHDAIGVARYSIVIGSFGSAGVLASALVVAAFASRLKR